MKGQVRSSWLLRLDSYGAVGAGKKKKKKSPPISVLIFVIKNKTKQLKYRHKFQFCKLSDMQVAMYISLDPGNLVSISNPKIFHTFFCMFLLHY